MLKAITEILFRRQPHVDELVKLRQIAERAQRFEKAVIESMSTSIDDESQPQRNGTAYDSKD